MTKAQVEIIGLIKEGLSTQQIALKTGKTTRYVYHLQNKVNLGRPKLARPKAKPVYHGAVKCLNCDREFQSFDRRYNRICPKCSGERININIESCLNQGHTHRLGME